MNRIHDQVWIFILMIALFLGACKTDPIVPEGGIPPADVPMVEDPGETNLCANGVISFQHQILPIMISACAYSGCHDAISAEDGIVLDSYENVIKEVNAGDANDSDLYESLIETDQDDIMPPPPASPLTSEQIKVVKGWINQGAENTDCGTLCDSIATSFAVDVFPLMQDYCIGCHNSNRSDGNVDIDGYNKIIPYVNTGSLMGTIRHDALYSNMPPGGSKMSECRVAQIQQWINEGAQNN